MFGIQIHSTAEVHKTAILSGNISIDENVVIGPYCIISGNVSIGAGTKLLGHIVISGDVSIGLNNMIYYFASIGTEPQDAKFQQESSVVTIGSNNIIREYVTINGGSAKGNSFANISNQTVIGNHCYLMIASHVAHDAILRDNVVLSNNVAVAGHVMLDDYVIIGGNSAIHQFVHIGKYSMIGGMCAIGHNILPFSLVQATAAKIAGVNIVGMKRNKFSPQDISIIKDIFHLLGEKNGKTISEKLHDITVNDTFAKQKNVAQLIHFIHSVNNRGIAEIEL